MVSPRIGAASQRDRRHRGWPSVAALLSCRRDGRTRPGNGSLHERRRAGERHGHRDRRRRPLRGLAAQRGLLRLRERQVPGGLALQLRQGAGQPGHRPRRQRQHDAGKDGGRAIGHRSLHLRPAGRRGRDLLHEVLERSPHRAGVDHGPRGDQPRVERVEASGGTAIYDAIADALPVAATGQHRKKAILVISDGNDTSSDISAGLLRTRIRESEVLVYALGVDAVTRTTTRAPRLPRPTRAPAPRPRPFPWPGHADVGRSGFRRSSSAAATTQRARRPGSA